jgi:hypothetical protein
MHGFFIDYPTFQSGFSFFMTALPLDLHDPQDIFHKLL